MPEIDKEARWVVEEAMFRTNTSSTAFVSDATKFVAPERKATMFPLKSIEGNLDVPLPIAPLVCLEIKCVVAAGRLRK
jgi:hypothetical protein